MITLLTKNGKIVCPVNDRTGEEKLHSYILEKDSLSLIYSIDKGYSSYALTYPSILPSNCFNNRLVVLPEFLKHAISDDQIFAPLALGIRQQFVHDPALNESTLLSYFYLNPVPSSVSLIARWFTDAGAAPERASILAKLVYIARTDKDDQDAGFIQDYEKSTGPGTDSCENGKSILIPQCMSEAFQLLIASDDSILTYDCLSQRHLINRGLATIIGLDCLSETGFLIEDHSLLIVGLAVAITELARLTEHRWPLFYEELLAGIPLYLRDFYSLGRLIIEKSEIILRLQSDYNLTMDVIRFSPDGKIQSSNIISPGLLAASKDRPEIPAFLRILK